MNDIKTGINSSNHPWYKATLTYTSEKVRLQLQVPHDVFSTQRIDEGTQLLLDHLAPSTPQTILDMGCGYGALGLPLAALYPNAVLELVDRDLLAVKWSEQNANENKLCNVKAYGSLGFRDVPDSRYDWILCNVPARIGSPFIQNLIEQGRARLRQGGDLRVVVINDLAPILLSLNENHHWSMVQVVRGERHSVFSFSALDEKPTMVEPEELYLRDQIKFMGLPFSRPFDLGGDDPRRLTQGLPTLLDVLPRDPRHVFHHIFCFRSGYGILPLLARKRWPKAKVRAVDRDLLATTFTRYNSEVLDLGGELLDVQESVYFSESIAPGETFDLMMGELSPSAGELVAIDEVRTVMQSLSANGQAYLLCADRMAKDWIMPFAVQNKMQIQIALKRDGYTVLRCAPQC